MSEIQTPGKGSSKAVAIGRSAILLLIGLAFGAVLFSVAGRLDWVEGWLFAGAMMAYLGGGAIIGIVRDPELIKERGSAISSARGLERAVLLLVFALSAAIIIIAALDAGRFGWSIMPVAVKALGWLLVIPALALPMWVGMVNTYASAVVRVQQERGHHVIAGGPYQYMRHPMYAGMVLLGIGAPLALGSWWALAPGLIWSITFVLRTAQEDSVLQRDLPGYAEYIQQVRYRLIPGIW
jgi:protein-S-isoprenylcysteine O-methyltransferase Ste14